MRKDKQKALELRRQGKSYNEIITSLRIPKGTLSGWLADVDWSKEVRRRLEQSAQVKSTVRILELNELRGVNLAKAYDEARAEARAEFEMHKYNPLFIAGVALYWGEGDKLTKYSTKLANTDPHLIRLYVFFLKNVCRIPEGKIKAHVLIYPDLDEEKCRLYWSSRSHIDLAHFTKCSVIQGKEKVRRLKYGVCLVGVSSTYFKVKLLEWLRLLPIELMNRRYYENMR
ncbi:MAG: hypothetical protein AAB442_00850 [Patescibacteria group bacterium]